ncbi:hypothetical protein H4R35_001272 [Dimargaris xerosporica]|nr:hypothetical protein H4R35_001272 [Dimargaris xerosporica]
MASAYQRVADATLRTPHHLSPHDVLNAAANQLLYSRYYTVFYVALGVLSLLSLIIALSETCPSTGFVVLESIICIAMAIEVGTRILALGKLYWESALNVVDILLVFFCIILLVLLSHGCSKATAREELFNTIVLLVRNCVQIFRVLMMIRQNQRHMDARDVTVQFSTEEEGQISYSGDLDDWANHPGLHEVIAVDDGYNSSDDLGHFHSTQGYTSASRFSATHQSTSSTSSPASAALTSTKASRLQGFDDY